jgi:hypothetical protein
MTKAAPTSTPTTNTTRVAAAKRPAKREATARKVAVKVAVKVAAKQADPVKKVAPARSAAATNAAATKAVPAKAASAKAVAPKAVLAKRVAVAGSVSAVTTDSKPSREKKPKMVRDSVTIPKAEYVVLEAMKQRAAQLKVTVKKTELIRAGMKHLAGLPDAGFLAAIAAIPSLKTGRPSKT